MADQRRQTSADSTLRWIWRGSAVAVLLLGWTFILIQNNFHVTAPVVFVSLGFFAAVASIYTLFRTGATAVAKNEEDDGDAAWGKPMGALAELDREKRALLKAIKEAEFDLEMGKLSKADADDMIARYRARAIEVIKEIDIKNTSSGKAGTVRDKILREARARLELETRSKGDKKGDKAGKADKPDKPDKPDKGDKQQQQRAAALADAVAAAAAPRGAPAPKADPAAPAEPAAMTAAEPAPGDAAVTAADAASDAAGAAEPAAAEPDRDAKEATS